jgi:hypothetical protein
MFVFDEVTVYHQFQSSIVKFVVSQFCSVVFVIVYFRSFAVIIRGIVACFHWESFIVIFVVQILFAWIV